MKSIYEIRRQNVRTLVRYSGTMAVFASRIDRVPSQVSRMIGKNPSRNVGERLARHIEECFCLPEFWLDTDHGSQKFEYPTVNQSSKDAHEKLHLILQTITDFAEIKGIDEITLAQLEELANKIKNE